MGVRRSHAAGRAGRGPGKTRPLFIIERSKNANVVHYDARLTADGKLDPKQPVIAYWIMLAKEGRREELSWIEKKKAHGFHIKPDPSVNGYKMTVVAAPPSGRSPSRRRGTRPPHVPGCSSTAGQPARFREDVHQGLRRVEGAHSPLSRAVWKRPADGQEVLRKDRAEVAAIPPPGNPKKYLYSLHFPWRVFS